MGNELGEGEKEFAREVGSRRGAGVADEFGGTERFHAERRQREVAGSSGSKPATRVEQGGIGRRGGCARRRGVRGMGIATRREGDGGEVEALGLGPPRGIEWRSWRRGWWGKGLGLGKELAGGLVG